MNLGIARFSVWIKAAEPAFAALIGVLFYSSRAGRWFRSGRRGVTPLLLGNPPNEWFSLWFPANPSKKEHPQQKTCHPLGWWFRWFGSGFESSLRGKRSFGAPPNPLDVVVYPRVRFPRAPVVKVLPRVPKRVTNLVFLSAAREGESRWPIWLWVKTTRISFWGRCTTHFRIHFTSVPLWDLTSPTFLPGR